MRLRYTRTAAAQIDSALGYIKAKSPQGANSGLQRADAICAILQLQPYAGHQTSRRGVLRIPIVPYPFVIDYRVNGDEILILRFRHTSRRQIP